MHKLTNKVITQATINACNCCKPQCKTCNCIIVNINHSNSTLSKQLQARYVGKPAWHINNMLTVMHAIGANVAGLDVTVELYGKPYSII
jgi:hypothetical protein